MNHSPALSENAGFLQNFFAKNINSLRGSPEKYSLQAAMRNFHLEFTFDFPLIMRYRITLCALY